MPVVLSGFTAVYHKSTDEPHLVLRQRSPTNDYKLLARVAGSQLTRPVRKRKLNPSVVIQSKSR
jgi:hypothetical protein